jgi:hypothetical protein
VKGYEAHARAVSTGDYSFTAQHDGKYIYCFSNEHWSASSKEVSFNVHGIVYVPEAEAPSDPLEAEGESLRGISTQHLLKFSSSSTFRALGASQGRAIIYRRSRKDTSKYRRKHKRASQVVEHLPNGSSGWGRHLPGVVVKEVLRGRQEQCRALWSPKPVTDWACTGQTGCLSTYGGKVAYVHFSKHFWRI